jgi:hypothetical protein
MNPLLAKVTGRALQESDVVPVPGGALTRRHYRDRAQRDRSQRENDEGASDMRRVVGESENTGVIPDSAEQIDDVGVSVLPKKMRAIKDVVQEPSHPSSDREKLLTPYAALTAPDATPDAMTPIDPSKVPGKSATFFTASELEKAEAPEEAGEAPNPSDMDGPGVDKATRTMDILLGRTRSPKAAKNPAEAAQAGAITSESAAYAALKIDPPGLSETAGAAIGAAMVPGNPMPDPVRTDAKLVCEAFRKFMR